MKVYDYASVKTEDVVKQINLKFCDVFHEKEGVLVGKVCLCCDRMIGVGKLRWIGRTNLRNKQELFKSSVAIKKEILDFYKYDGNGKEEYMNDCCFSPKGCFEINNGKGRFALCDTCFVDICHGRKPYFALANNWMFGEPPAELKCLNDMELAIVARARISGHIFTFYGGQHKSIRGMHSLYDVNTAHLCGSIERMEKLGFPAVIACVLNGPFTKGQKQIVRDKVATVNREKVKAALDWLRKNNEHYSDISESYIKNYQIQ